MKYKKTMTSLIAAATFAALACSDDDDRYAATDARQMPVQARNVKVITQDGVVTLRGPVETQEEKASIELLAKNAGATRIDNQLEIDRDVDSGDYKE